MSKETLWTKEQLQAIETDNCNILVAAAAGSGKTAVLVERIIQGLLRKENPLDIERLLVVTFTEAAAAEMRSRIGGVLEKALSQNPYNENLQKQLLLLNKASISTIHSFCLSVVRQYFYRLDLDPLLDVMGANESVLLKQEILDKVLEDKYENGGEEFIKLVSGFGAGREDKLGELVLKLENFLAAQVSPNKWLEDALKPYEKESKVSLEKLPWYPLAIKIISEQLEDGRWQLEQAYELCSLPDGPTKYQDNLKAEIEGFEALIALLQEKPSWQTLRQQIGGADFFEKLPSVKKEEADEKLKKEVAVLRDKAKGILATAKEYFARTEDELLDELKNLGPILTELASLVKEMQKEYQGAKKQKRQVDFNDLERYALMILGDFDEETGQINPTDAALAFQEKFQAVMIDEYQDTNDLQEEILKLVSRQSKENPNLFMVGDVKQSIYRFRQANPGLFLNKYETYSKEKGETNRKILLSANFRSRKEVVEGTNFLFRQIMTAETGELDYDADAELIFSATYPEPESGIKTVAGPVELHLFDNKNEMSINQDDEFYSDDALAELSSLEKEAHFIANRIREMMGLTGKPPVHVWDKNLKAYRKISFKDIIILLRSTQNKANTFLEVFQQYNIPAYAEVSTGYFQATEVGVVLSLLKIIDNPIQDIHLAAVLRSPLVGLDSSELAEIRAYTPKGPFWDSVFTYAHEKPREGLGNRLDLFIKKLNKWRILARRGPLSHLIWQIYQETGFLDYVGAMPGGKQRRANLLALYERAIEFDSFARHGLFRFLRFIEKLQEQDEDLGLAGAFGESDDVVRIMSIHKSKGLEFPVVFLANLGGKFNLKDAQRDLLFHPELGFGSIYFDLELRVKYPTMPYWVIKESIKKATIAEELRILYVAFTRAREKLILTGTTSKLENKIGEWEDYSTNSKGALPDYLLRKSNSFLDWVGPALVGKEENFIAVYPRIMDANEQEIAELESEQGLAEDNKTVGLKINLADFTKHCLEEIVDEELQNELTKQLSWSYPHLLATEKPAKLSATEVKRHLQAGIEDEGEKLLYKSKISTRPRFVQETKGLSGAELGTAMHLVMQHLDFQKVETKEEIRLQIEEMVNQEFLTFEQAESVGWKSFLDFFQSPIGKRLQKADPEAIKREMPFTFREAAHRVFSQLTEAGEENLIIQGIIDCLLIEEDGIVLIDYKNDEINPKNFDKVVNGYRLQLELYARAIEEIFQLPVKEKYLYFFKWIANGGVVTL